MNSKIKNKKSVVVIGGGTGTFAVLSALRDKNISITALMTMVDDGGSNKVLRNEFGLLPTSGIRQAMVALSEKRSLMRDLFMYRYHKGNGISGMTFGNLFLAAMADILGSQEKAIEETAKFLSIKGNILPISLDDIQLVATYEDGSEVIGEHLIDEPEGNGTLRITNLRTEPKGTINPKAKQAITDADLIVLGPGDFYTNTVANLIIDGVGEAVQKSKAKIVFVMNLMTKFGETYNYKASDYIKDLSTYLPISKLSYIVLNSDNHYPRSTIKEYENEQSWPVLDDLETFPLPETITVLRKSLLSSDIITPQKGDTLKRTVIRHDTEKLGEVLTNLLTKS